VRPALGVDGTLGGNGSGANGTALLAADAAGSVPIALVAGAGAGGLLALLALLCCLWWLLCLVPRRKREAAARARAKRASRIGRSAKLERGQSAATMAGMLGLPSRAPSAPAGSKATSGRGRPGDRVAAGAAAGGSAGGAAMADMFSAMNPALLRAKRGGGAGGGGPSGDDSAGSVSAARRGPRMTMALAAYKKPMATFKPAATAGASAQARHGTALLDDDGAAEAFAAATDAYGETETAAEEGSAYGGWEGQPAEDGAAWPPADDAAAVAEGEAAGATSYGDNAGPGAAAEDEVEAAAGAAGEGHPDVDDDADAEDDDYMDEDEPVDAAVAAGVPGRAVKGGGYLRSKQKKVAEAAAAPLPPEPKKLVIGRGALITEKVETQTVKLRRVSKIRGDKGLTEMRAQASSRVARPSVAPLGGAAFSPMASSRNVLGGGRSSVAHGAGSAGDAEAGGGLTTYGFIATVARLKVKAETARAAVGERHAAATAAAGAAPDAAPWADAAAVPEPSWTDAHHHPGGAGGTV
jgi:hypothetical protein